MFLALLWSRIHQIPYRIGIAFKRNSPFSKNLRRKFDFHQGIDVHQIRPILRNQPEGFASYCRKYGALTIPLRLGSRSDALLIGKGKFFKLRRRNQRSRRVPAANQMCSCRKLRFGKFHLKF